MKKIISIVLVILALLAACSKRVDYRDDLPCSALTEHLYESGEYSSYGEEHIKYSFENTDICDNYSLIYSTEPTEISELGVLHAKDPDSADQLYRITLRYIDGMQKNDRAFIASYAPSQLTLLDGAVVKRYGSYIVYAILDEEKKADELSRIEEMLKK